MFGRVVVLVVALVACAWFVLGIRETQDQARVASLLSRHATITPAQARVVDATLTDAQFLNPDQAVQITRSIVARRAGDRRGAIAIARAVVQREPQNVGNWLLLSFLLTGTDSATFRSAQAHIRLLAPPVPLSR